MPVRHAAPPMKISTTVAGAAHVPNAPAATSTIPAAATRPPTRVRLAVVLCFSIASPSLLLAPAAATEIRAPRALRSAAHRTAIRNPRKPDPACAMRAARRHARSRLPERQYPCRRGHRDYGSGSHRLQPAACRRRIDGFLDAQVGQVFARAVVQPPAALQVIDHVALQAQDAVAGEADVVPAVRDLALLVLSERAVEQATVAVEPDRAGRAFDQHLAHRQPAIVGGVIDEAIAVEQGAHARCELEQNEARVLARDRRIQAAKAPQHRVYLAEQEAEGVDEMN